jgi:hypothetical protein
MWGRLEKEREHFIFCHYNFGINKLEKKSCVILLFWILYMFLSEKSFAFLQCWVSKPGSLNECSPTELHLQPCVCCSSLLAYYWFSWCMWYILVFFYFLLHINIFNTTLWFRVVLKMCLMLEGENMDFLTKKNQKTKLETDCLV